jgi:hypothetical protein
VLGHLVNTWSGLADCESGPGPSLTAVVLESRKLMCRPRLSERHEPSDVGLAT